MNLKGRSLFAGFMLFSGLLFGIEPTTPASNIVVSNADCVSAQISWTNGNGAWRLVLVREASAVNGIPVDAVKYTSSPSFGGGSQIGSGNFVCYSNLGNSFTLTNLKQNTTYHIAVFEHDGLDPDYLTTNPATASFTTKDLKLNFTYSYTDSCQNTNVINFKNNTTTTLSGVKYTWLFKDGTTDTGFNVSHTYMKGGNYYVQLIAIPSGGCTNTFTVAKPVLIVPRPVSTPVEKNNDTAQCFSGNHFFFDDRTTLAFVPNTGYVRTWYFSPTDSATFPTPDRKFSKPGIYRIFFKSETLYDNKRTGCTDTTSLVIRVIPDPSSGVTVNDSIQCLAGNQFRFDNTYPGLVSFNWDFGDGGSSNSKATNHTYTAVGVYPVIHQAASLEGCSSKDTTIIQVKPNTSGAFSGLPAEICEDEPPVELFPATKGGFFIGPYMTDSLFTPSNPGSYTIKYLVPDTFCPDSSTQDIIVKPLPRFSLGPDENICNGGSIDLNITAGGTIQWEDGSSNNPRTISNAGMYWAKVTENGCSWTDTVNLYVGTTPEVTLPNDTLLCRGTILRLTANWPGSTVQWSTGSRDTQIYVTNAGIYTVAVTNPCGTATDDIIVRYAGEYCDIFIPDAFTPNGDNKNEFFEILGRDINPRLFLIYDRWGAKVFDSRTNQSFKWDGTHNGQICGDGMYFYLFNYEVISGDIKRRNTIEGSVLLYR